MAMAILALQGIAFAAPDVQPPSNLSACAGTSTPRERGSAVVTPGRWWNPKRYGTGWDFHLSGSQTRLLAQWYTYDGSRRPTWLLSNPVTVDFANNTWASPLYRYTWDYQNNRRNPGERVGSVAIRFDPNNPVRVALRWQWDAAGTAEYTECVYDFQRPQVPVNGVSSMNGANATFSGTWHEPGLDGWGVFVSIATQTATSPTSYAEYHGVSLYTTSGEARWLQTYARHTATAPPLGVSETFSLYYPRAGTAYPGGVPTTDCEVPPLLMSQCVEVLQPAGSFARTYVDPDTAQVSIAADASTLVTGDTYPILWTRPASGAGTVELAKLTDPAGIVVDRLQCTVLPGQTTCPITVDWGSLDPTLKPYRRDLTSTATPVLISNATVGEFTDQLAPGARVMYALQTQPQAWQGAISTPEVRAINGNVADQALDELSADKRIHDPTVGAVDGEGSVEGGAAKYRVPIVVPPGRRGMQPELALEYSSRDGNGIAGVGFALTGMSSIHRCPRTPSQDGEIRAVRFDGNDALCLDGERLVPVTPLSGGTCRHPTSGTATTQREFRTEIDRFARILQCAGSIAPSSATWFQVESSDGLVDVYGTTTAAQGTPGGGGTPLSWHRDRRTDRSGNFVEWTYATYSPAELLPSLIRYTGCSGTGCPQEAASVRREVVFSYEARPAGPNDRDLASAWLAGFSTRQTQRLKTITTTVGGSSVRQYSLIYDQNSPNSGRSLLRRVSACAFEGTTPVCMPDTSFEWKDASSGFAVAPLALSGIAAFVPPVPGVTDPNPASSAQPPLMLPFFDLDGDGTREALVTLRTGGTQRKYLASLSADRQVTGVVEVPQALLAVLELSPGFADFDGDGRADILGRSQSSATSLVSWHWIPDAGSATFNGGRLVEQSTGISVSATLTTDLLVHAGDVDGDGLADIVIDHFNSSTPGPSARELRIYRNTTPAGSSTLSFNPTFTRIYLPRIDSNAISQHALERVSDFDGDGLVEYFVRGERNAAGTADRDKDTVWFGSRGTGGTYAVAQRGWLTLFPSGSATHEEQSPDLTAFWTDVNGDGLDDWVYAGCAPSQSCGRNQAVWTVRINQGLTLGSRSHTQNKAGIELCVPDANNSLGCSYGQNGVFRPLAVNLLRVVDIDGDGRSEIAVPSANQPFAALICRVHPAIPWGQQGCPINPPSFGGESSHVTNPQGLVCGEPFYICPENPRTGAFLDQPFIAGPIPVHFKEDRLGNDGVAESWAPLSDPFGDGAPTVGEYQTGRSYGNSSLYRLDVVRFVETAAGGIDASEFPGQGLTASATGGLSEDVYGDGLSDILAWHGCRWGLLPDHAEIGLPCAVPRMAFNKELSGKISPTAISTNQDQSLYPDQPLLKTQYLVSENLGAGIRSTVAVKRSPHLPDHLAQAIDGFGNSVAWTYDPLSSSFARYRVLGTSRRIDGQHVQFASSMPVVSAAIFTTGLGTSGLRSVNYAYRDALYDRLGRGFRGFRQIIAEDQLDGRRAATTFHQRFPLTGRIARTEISANSRALATVTDPTGELGGTIDATSAPISVEHQVWRCTRSNRATPCADVVGQSQIWFPFLDRRESWNYDVASAANAGATWVSTPIGHTRWIAAASAAATASGYDAYGNLLAEITEVDDGGTALDTGGYTPIVNRHTRIVSRCIDSDDSDPCAGPVATNWWIRRLRREDVSDAITYSSDHALPSGASAPLRQVRRAWTYDATSRLPLTERVYPDGATTPSLTTTTTYDPNYGQPLTITLNPQNFGAGSTSTTLGYSTNYYFPLTRTNSLSHRTTEVRRDRDGAITSTTDPDGLIDRYTLDAWGRTLRVDHRNAADNADRLPARHVAYRWNCDSACPPGSVFQVTQVQPGVPTTTASIDSIGRTLRVDTKLEDNSTSRVDTIYHPRGFLEREEAPHRTTETAYATTWADFDLAGRPGTKTILRAAPTDGLGNLVVRYTYSGRQTAVRVQGSNDNTSLASPCPAAATKCLDMSRLVDAFGRVVRTRDAAGGRVRYWFDGPGNAVAIEDPLTPTPAITTATYNSLGQRLSSVDPDRGTFSWTYDGLGNVLSQTDPRNISGQIASRIITNYSYDVLGRRTGRIAAIDLDGVETTRETITDTWLFDPPSGVAKGQLYQSSRSVHYQATGASKLERRSTHQYDALARRTSTAVEQRMPDDTLETFTTSVVYDDNYGRPKAEVHPTGDVRWLRYSRYGHLNLESGLTGSAYWATQTVNARGQPTQATQGPITRTATYDAASGQLTSLRYALGASTLRQLTYAYDVYDNLASAQLGAGATTETYAYDKLLRLTSATRAGGVTGSVTYAYDAAGSFRHKSDQSTVTATAPYAYRYGSGNLGGVTTDAGPHAVTQVSLSGAYGGGTRTLGYDDAGNLTSGSNAGSSLGPDSFGARYDHDQLPVFVYRNGSTVLGYGPDGERTRQDSPEGSWTWVGAFERSVQGANVERRAYLGNHTQLSTRSGNTGVQLSYLLTDRLGSVDAIADAAGTLRETRGYDAFGKPRQGTWADANALPSTARTTRGFTQHVHLDGARLIHMNGRAYDYQLGRFLSVDPVIQFPTNSQSLNPYSYILNNPLSGTDPTGFFTKSLCAHSSNFSSSGTCGNELAVLNNLESTSGRLEKRNLSSGGDNRSGPTGSQSRGNRAAPAEGRDGKANRILLAQNGMESPEAVCAHLPHRCTSTPGADELGREIDELEERLAPAGRIIADEVKNPLNYMAGPIAASAKIAGWVKRLFGIRVVSKADDVVGAMAGAAGDAARELAPQIAKIEKQLAQHGRRSVERSLRSLENRLAEHRQALESYRAQGGYTSSVEREIRAFEIEIQAIKDVLGREP